MKVTTGRFECETADSSHITQTSIHTQMFTHSESARRRMKEHLLRPPETFIVSSMWSTVFQIPSFDRFNVVAFGCCCGQRDTLMKENKTRRATIPPEDGTRMSITRSRPEENDNPQLQSALQSKRSVLYNSMEDTRSISAAVTHAGLCDTTDKTRPGSDGWFDTGSTLLLVLGVLCSLTRNLNETFVQRRAEI